MPCFGGFNAAMCLSSVGAQEQSSENWLGIWKQNGFAQISDDELVEQFASEAKLYPTALCLRSSFYGFDSAGLRNS